MLRSSFPTRCTALSTSARLSARITPRLAARSTGLITHGSPVQRTAASSMRSSASASISTTRGCTSPDAVRRLRSRRLSRVACTAATGLLCATPNRSAMLAAVTTDSSSTPTTASTGHRAANRSARAADSSGRCRSSVRMRPSISVANVGASLEATTTSRPSSSAARRNAVARYVSVGRTSITLGIRSAYARDWNRRTMDGSVKEPRIAITDYALTRIEQVRANRKQPDAGVRIAVTGRQAGAFTYDLSLVNAGDERDGELVVSGPSGVRFTMPLASAPYLDGISIDADLARDVQQLLDDEINPSVASHGGYIDLLDVSDGVAFIHMGGVCQGCGMAEVTLGQGVRVAILERFPQITEVRDTTDHAQGANPYYQAAKK